VTTVHLAPFNASRYPPLINTVAVCQRVLGRRSIVIASAPVPDPGVFGSAEVVCPPDKLSAIAQQLFLMRTLRDLPSRAVETVIAHNIRGLAAMVAWPPLLNARLVYHCHDFEFEGADGRTPSGFALRTTERLMAHRVDEIWVPAEERISIAVARGLPRPLLVKNCPQLAPTLKHDTRLREFVAASVGHSKRLKILVRHGNIGPAHCILETIEALPLLSDEIVFVVIGDGSRDYIDMCAARARALGVERRFFLHPFVPHDQLLTLISGGDVAMCLYAPLDMNSQAPAPNKVYESLAVGMPVVVTHGNSVTRDVTEAGAGVGVELGSKERLAEAFARMLEPDTHATMRDAARRAHLRTLNYEAQLEMTLLRARSRASANAGDHA
jgi:glycosyltransferase involved in cell wall biosynthesis